VFRSEKKADHDRDIQSNELSSLISSTPDHPRREVSVEDSKISSSDRLSFMSKIDDISKAAKLSERSLSTKTAEIPKKQAEQAQETDSEYILQLGSVYISSSSQTQVIDSIFLKVTLILKMNFMLTKFLI
jgi:hypothetical protein